MIGPAAISTVLLALLASVGATPTPTAPDPFHLPRSVVDAHKRATGQLIERSVPLPRWLQGPKEASSFMPRDNLHDPHRLTARASSKASPSPSVSPAPKSKIGIYVQVLDGTNSTSGFLSAELDYYGNYGLIITNQTKAAMSKALRINIAPESDGTPSDITVGNGKYYQQFPYLGLVLGDGYKGEDLGAGNKNFVGLAGVAKEKVSPLGLNKAYQSTYGVATGSDNPAQYNTWVEGTFALKQAAASNVLTPMWTNTNGSEYAVEFYYTSPANSTYSTYKKRSKKRNGFLMGSVVPSSGHSVFARDLSSLGAGAAAVILTALPL